MALTDLSDLLVACDGPDFRDSRIIFTINNGMSLACTVEADGLFLPSIGLVHWRDISF